MTKNPLNLRLSEIMSLRGSFEFYRERIDRYNDKLNAFLQVSNPFRFAKGRVSLCSKG